MHAHTHLINFKAKECEVYLDKFCQDICLGVKGEIADKASRSRNTEQQLMKIISEAINKEAKAPHDDTEEYEWLYSGKEFHDDFTREYMDKDRAIATRKLEMDFFCKMRVYSKVPRKMAIDSKAKAITTRWIDVYKGDAENLDYRSRLAAPAKSTPTNVRICSRRHPHWKP